MPIATKNDAMRARTTHEGDTRVNEEERVKRLSDAIDALLQGDQPELDLDDDDLIELLRIARLRHRVGQARGAVALACQEFVWRVLQARMTARQMEQETDPHPQKRMAP